MISGLVFNTLFLEYFIPARPPCSSLGVLYHEGKEKAFIALKPVEDITTEIQGRGLNFGHQIIEYKDDPLIRFLIHFYGSHTYDIILNPNNKCLRYILARMIMTEDFFILLMDSDNHMMTYYNGPDSNVLFWLKKHSHIINSGKLLPEDYQMIINDMEKRKKFSGIHLPWLSYEDDELLDLKKNRFEANPVG